MKFKSEKLQKQFNDDGIIRIPSFLKKEDLRKMKGLYDELDLKKLKGMYTNVKFENAEFNNRVDQLFQEVFNEPIHLHFNEVKKGGGFFLVKGTGDQSHSLLHQDWNVVDESMHSSAFIFCPLVDVDEQNGCLQAIKGSHKWFQNIRSLNIPPPDLPFEKVTKGLISFPARAGDAIIFRQNLIHGSKQNFTSKIRVAAFFTIASKGADFIHYKKQGNELTILKADNSFYNQQFIDLYANKEVVATVLSKRPIMKGDILTSEDFVGRYKKEFPDTVLKKLSNFILNR